MGRRRTGVAEDVTDLVAMMPWWAGVALAFVSYLILHRLATMPSGAVQPGQMASFAGRAMVAAFAFWGQIIVPVICLFGALISFVRRRQRAALINNVTDSKSPDVLNHMSWHEFELLVGEAFRLQGFNVVESGGAQPDGGVDLVLQKGTEKFLVQCKQWKAFKVSVNVVRELYGLIAARGAAGGFVITSGSFTADAREFAEGRNIRLVEGPKLFGLIQQVRAARAVGNTRTAPVQPRPAAGSDSAALACPICNSPMILRTARKGGSAGNQFWGCSRFPACRGTR